MFWQKNYPVSSALLCLLLFGGGVAACGSEPDPTDQRSCPSERATRCPDNSCVADASQCPDEQESCPADRATRCPDDSCVADASQCPGEQESCPADRATRCPDDSCVADASQCPGEQPGDIAGEIVDIRPRTMLAHVPEPVQLMLTVEDADRVKELVEAGASWQVEIETSSGMETVAASASQSDGEHDYTLEFTPEPNDGPQQVAVAAQLLADGKVYAWGRAKLRYRGDASTLDIDGRDSYSLGQITAADRTWSPDLDGDGLEDLVVSNVEEDASGAQTSTLHFFKCGPEKCEPVGAVETSAPSGDQIVAPDRVVSGGQSDGFLAATISSRSGSGDISGIEVLRVELIDDGSGHSLRDTRAKINLATSVRLGEVHEQTIKPLLLLDAETRTYRPGLTLTRTIDNRGHLQWSTLVIDANGVQSDFSGHRVFEGLNEEQIQAALGGQLSVCSPGKATKMSPENAPTGVLVSTFELDGKPAIGVASIPAIGGPVETFIFEEFDLDELFGQQGGGGHSDAEYGSAKCKLGDLDDDGREDLMLSLSKKDVFSRLGASTGQPASLLLAMGVDETDAELEFAAPKLVIDQMDADSHGFTRTGDELHLNIALNNQSSTKSFSISKRSARTGRNPQLSVDLDHDGLGDVRMSIDEISLRPQGTPIFRLDRPETLESLASGSDRVVRKKPGRTRYADITLNRAYQGSTQLVGDHGTWVLARFGGTIHEGQGGAALLETTDPKTILGSIGTTGPFLPVETSSGSDDGSVGELSEILYLPSADNDPDATTPLLYQLRLNEKGAPTGVISRELILDADRATLGDEQVYDLDNSQVELEGKRAVKFKAGAELSKSVNIAAPDDGDDCDDQDSCPRPDEVLLAVELDTGEILSAVLKRDGREVPTLRDTGALRSSLNALGLASSSDLSGLETSLRISHDGREPVIIHHAIHIDGDTLNEVDETFSIIDRDGDMVVHESLRESSTQPVTLFGDVMGEGSDQMVVCRAEERGSTHCTVSRLGGEAAERRHTEVSADGAIKCVVDIDGDRCADLVTDAGELISSRCDGGFEPTTVELGAWAAHMVCGEDSLGSNRAQDYNAARSNKPTSIAWDEDDDDHDGPVICTPLFDGLQRPDWD